MKYLGISILVAVMALATNASAETPLWQSDEPDPQIIQQISNSSVLFCRPGGFAGVECDLLDAKSSGQDLSFEKRPFNYEILKGETLRATNTLQGTTKQIGLQRVVPQFSAAKYSGNWGGSAPASIEITRLSKGKGRLNYVFRGDKSWMNFTTVGGTLVVKLPNGIEFYFVQLANTAYGHYKPVSGQTYDVNMKAEPYRFKSPAVCAQSYLNHLGYEPGKADGKPGRKSRAASQAYLDSNPDIGLQPLTRDNAEAWCSHLQARVSDPAGVVAVSGW